MEFLARMFFHLFLILFVAVAVPISTVVALVAIVREFMFDFQSDQHVLTHKFKLRAVDPKLSHAVHFRSVS